MRTPGLLLKPALTCVFALALFLDAPARAAGTPPALAERARALEEVGRFAEAARLYEAALQDGNAPALLYRLALCKRHLGDYAGAREALRGSLREEPGGPLRIEVERQLAQLQVLIEERGLHPERVPRGGKKAAQGSSAGRATGGDSAAPQGGASGSVPGSVPGSGSVSGSVSGSEPVPLSAAISTPSFAPAPAAEPSTARASGSPVPAAAQASTLPSAPAVALAPPVGRSLKPALPFAVGAAVAGLAGALLVWDGARVSSGLDVRFAAGDLTAADQPRYTRAHRESIAGVALLSLAVLAAGAAVWAVAF